MYKIDHRTNHTLKPIISLEENTGKHFCDLRSGKDFLPIIPKAHSIKEEKR